MTDLRNKITKLAYENPGEVRDALMPLLASGSKEASSLSGILRKYPEFSSEIQREIKGLKAALRRSNFGQISDALMDIQMALEDRHRGNLEEFRARSPLNRELAEYAKAQYTKKTGEPW
jgi:hypothetical protein